MTATSKVLMCMIAVIFVFAMFTAAMERRCEERLNQTLSDSYH